MWFLVCTLRCSSQKCSAFIRVSMLCWVLKFDVFLFSPETLWDILEAFCPTFFFFLMFIIFERQRERERKPGWGRERGRHRIRTRLQALPTWARTHKPWDHDLSRNQTLNRLSHLGAPSFLSNFLFPYSVQCKNLANASRERRNQVIRWSLILLPSFPWNIGHLNPGFHAIHKFQSATSFCLFLWPLATILPRSLCAWVFRLPHAIINSPASIGKN